MPTPFSGAGRIKVAVVTGRHCYDVVGFHSLFRRMPDVDAYHQHIKDFSADHAKARDQYDVALFYHWHKETPEGDEWPGELGKGALDWLGETGQGIFVLHHALLCHNGWPAWTEITGIPDRTVTPHHGETVRVEVVDPDHPITQGLESWEMVDETYAMADTDADSHLLLATDHPRCMRSLAWTRQYKKSRVFCLELGHDDLAYTNPSFHTMVERGIRWCASEL
jgi:uncharacterized protein